MNILKSYTLKYLRLNRRRTVVTIIGVILSCGLLCGTAVLAASFWNMGIRTAIANSGNYHALFSGVPSAKAGYLTENSAVQTGMTSRVLGFSALQNSRNPYKPYVFVVGYDANMLKTQPLKLVSGRFPQKSGEIVVSQDMISEKSEQVKAGEKITLSIGRRVKQGETLSTSDSFETGERLAGIKRETFTVTGVIQKPEYQDYSCPGYTAIAYLDPNQLAPSDQVDVSLLLKNPVKAFQTVPKMAQEAGIKVSSEYNSGAVTLNYNTSLLTWLGARTNSSYTFSMAIIVAVIVLIIMIGSIGVIYNAFSISVGERKKQFGMLASVGATSRQIRRMVFFEALIIGAVGIPFGILGGIAGIAAVISIASGILKSVLSNYETLRLTVSPAVIAVTLLTASLTIWISALIPAKRASKVSPIDAIRQSSEYGNIKRRKLKSTGLAGKLFGFEGELAIKSLKRDRKKYRTTVFSLFISIVMFVSFSSLMLYSFQETGTKSLPKYDFSAYLNNSGKVDYTDFIRQAQKLSEVKECEVIRCIDGVVQTDSAGLSAEIKKLPDLIYGLDSKTDEKSKSSRYNVDVAVMTLGKEAFAKYVKALGLNEADYENTNRPEGIFVNRNSIYMTDQTTHQNKHYVFDMLRLKTGGTVAVSQQKMSENDRPKAIDITVGAVDNRIVQDDMPSHGVYIYVSDTVYNSLASKFNKISISNTITMNFSTRNNGKFDTEIKNLYTRLYGGTLSCSNTMTERRNTQMMVWLVDLFCYGFITLITLIGVTNIINTINTSVRLRKREFAVLKSVGLTPKGFGKMLRCESLFYGLKALLYGLPVSIGISYLLYRQFASGFQDFQRFSLPWGALSGCVAGVFVIIFATMMYASVKVKDENIVDAIREENL